MADSNELVKMAAQGTLAAIVVFAVFVVMAAAIYFHSKKHTFPAQTIKLLQWLIRVLVYLFVAASLSASGLGLVGRFLR